MGVKEKTMARYITLLTTLVLGVAVCGCRTSPPCTVLPQNNQTMMHLAEAGLYLSLLKDAGVLPELKQKGEHGNIETMPVVNPSQTAFYPFSARLAVNLNDREAIYWFIVEKQDETAEWRVIRIWKTDKKSHVLNNNLTLPDISSQAEANAKVRQRMKEWMTSQPASRPAR